MDYHDGFSNAFHEYHNGGHNLYCLHLNGTLMKKNTSHVVVERELNLLVKALDMTRDVGMTYKNTKGDVLKMNCNFEQIKD